MKPQRIQVMLQYNHWRDGTFKGTVSGIAVDPALHLESPFIDRALKLTVDEKAHTIMLGRQRGWQYSGYATWVGNWCWDAVWLTPGHAAQLLEFARTKGYKPDSGLVEVWDAFERGALTGEMLVKATAKESIQ